MRHLSYVNLLGIVGLAVLCGFQWEANRQANLRAESLDKTRQEQVNEITRQKREIAGYAQDLREAQAQITTLRDERDTAAAARDQAIAERDQLKVEREQTREVLAKWMTAVKDRDEAIQKAVAEIKELIKERDGKIGELNDVIGKYNALVKETTKGAAAR